MITMRNARPADVDKICGYKRESIKLNFPGSEFKEEMFKKHLLRQVTLKPDTVKVVEIDGHMAGYVWFKLVDSAVGSFGRIEHIFVDENFRGQGVGKKLMSGAEEHFRGHGTKKIKLTVTTENKAAISLYKGLGYKTKRFVMEKDL
jgi:ribosomal protein S18 acetylase RimI-like enzyme